MTKEEKLATLKELRASAEKAVKEYNDLTQEKEYEKAAKVAASIDDTIETYTGIARTLCFDECKESADPMKAACTKLTYPTIGLKDEKVGDNKETQLVVRSVIDVEKPIDLLRLHKYCGGIGADEKWWAMAEKFNMLMTAQKAVDLGIDPKAINDSYAMSKIAADIDMGKTPTSNTNILRTLQAVISAMIGDDNKALSHDVNYLKSIYSKKGRKALTVVCANHRYMRNYLMEICHRILTGGTYGMEFKAKKNR